MLEYISDKVKVDVIVSCLSDRNGLTIKELKKCVQEKGYSISSKKISQLLVKMNVEGLVEYQSRRWYYTEDIHPSFLA